MRSYARIEKWNRSAKVGVYTTDSFKAILEDFALLGAEECLVIRPVQMEEEQFIALPEWKGW